MSSVLRRAEAAPEVPSWWPDWRGHPAVIVASGPSAKKANVAQLRDRLYAIAIKENVQLCPWADIVYGCDAAWWNNETGLKKYQGLKLSNRADAGHRFEGIERIDIDKSTDQLLTGSPGFIGSGGNSGFQALNLAVQFGATRIMLIGFDMHDRSGIHWYGRAEGFGRNNPMEYNFRRWRGAFAKAAPVIAAMGIEVVNASPISDLKCFRRATIESIAKEWRL